MTDLTGRTVQDTYKDLLQVSNSNSGVDNSLRDVEDGEGTTTQLQLSTTQVSINGIVYPTSDGTNGQVMVTDGAGALSFTDMSAGGSVDELNDIGDVTISGVASGEILKWNGSAWINNTLAEAGIAAASHTHATSDITSGTFADARIAESNVTQHEAALTITESQISDLAHLTTEQVQDIAGAMTTGNTETGIAVTYQDGDGTIDYVVSDTTVAGDTGSTGITPGDTLTIAGGTNVTTAMSGDTLTINASGGGSVEGTAVLSTGEVGGTKFLREDGDGTCSWQTPAGSGDMVLADAQTVTGAKTYDSGTMIYAGSTSGTTTVNATAVAGTTTLTLPAATDTLVGKATTDTFTNKSGNISMWTNDSGYITATLTDEEVQDIAGAMFTGNTETLITATYQDADGTIDLVVDNDLANYSNATSAFITASSSDTLTNKGGAISQWTNDSGYITATLTQEEVEDYAGALVATGGTKTLITVTYQDATGDMDFVVDNDLANYSNTNSAFITASSTDTLTNKTINTASNTITVVEADISDLGSYITASSTDTLTNKTFDANGTGNSLSNVDVADLANGTDGELITWDAAGAPATVAVGTSGHVLTSNGTGAAPTFQAAAGGGGGGAWDYVSTSTPSAAATLDLTGLTSANAYMVVFRNVIPATDAADLRFRVSDDNGVSFAAVDYQYCLVEVSESGAVNGDGSSTISSFALNDSGGTGIGTGTGEWGISGVMHLHNINVTGEPMNGTWIATYQDTTGDITHVTGSGISQDDSNGGATTEIDAIRFYFNTGNIESGTFELYSQVTS